MTIFTEIITDGSDFSLVLGLLAATLEQFDAFAAALICEQRPVRLVRPLFEPLVRFLFTEWICASILALK